MENYNPEKYLKQKGIVEDDNWYYLPFDNDFAYECGWKFYIPISPVYANEILNKILPILYNSNIPFKYAKNERQLGKINSGAAGWTQIGKNIVFYMPVLKKETLIKILKELYELNIEYPNVHHANQLVVNAPLYYRFGNYTKKENFEDDRYAFDRKKIESTFINNVASEIGSINFSENYSEKLNSFLLSYPPIDVLSQSGKGGVFKCLDLKELNYTEAVLKVGYYLGAQQKNGVDGAKLLHNEILVTELIAESSPKFKIPKIINMYASRKSIAVVYELINGTSGLKLLLEDDLSTNDIISCINSIKELHDIGIIWGDAKIGNVIFHDVERMSLYLIDFENSYKVGAQPITHMRTFEIKDLPQNIDNKSRDIIEFLVSILFDIEHDSQSNTSISNLLLRGYKMETKQFAREYLVNYLNKLKI